MPVLRLFPSDVTGIQRNQVLGCRRYVTRSEVRHSRRRRAVAGSRHKGEDEGGEGCGTSARWELLLRSAVHCQPQSLRVHHKTRAACCIATDMADITAVLTTDPVKLRVALLAADPPDNAKPARHR
jgi:hypothetical protein